MNLWVTLEEWFACDVDIRSPVRHLMLTLRMLKQTVLTKTTLTISSIVLDHVWRV